MKALIQFTFFSIYPLTHHPPFPVHHHALHFVLKYALKQILTANMTFRKKLNTFSCCGKSLKHFRVTIAEKNVVNFRPLELDLNLKLLVREKNNEKRKGFLLL